MVNKLIFKDDIEKEYKKRKLIYFMYDLNVLFYSLLTIICFFIYVFLNDFKFLLLGLIGFVAYIFFKKGYDNNVIKLNEIILIMKKRNKI